MTQELAQIKETNPIIQPSTPNSKARGYENIAKVLGNIAERSIAKVADYATEASKTNLLQTKSMLDDVSSKSKLEMLKSPEHAGVIAKNAEQTTNKIKATARLNRQDRVNLDLATKDINRDLNFKAQEKTIQMTNEAARYSTLSAFNSTLKDLSTSLYTNPEMAEKTIEAQYQSLAGQVRAGILTAVEAANLHKQLEHEVDRASIILEGYKQENLTASDVNALHAASPEANQPFSNANLPMTHDTMFHANHHLEHLANDDIKSKWAEGGYVAPIQLAGVKKLDTLDSLLRYKKGTAHATGDIQAGVSWKMLKNRLDVLQKTQKLSTEQEGYKNRLNNYIVGIEKNNQYANYISQTPAGAQAYLDYTNTHAITEQHRYFGDPNQIAQQRHEAGVDNLNNLVSKLDAVGIGADVPDAYRQPIPTQYVQPIVDGFNEGGNTTAAINNIGLFNNKNRMYVMNAFPRKYRQQLTVYEIGNLIGKAEPGFMQTLLASQQVNPLGEKATGKKDDQEKFLQLSRDRGFSDNKLVSRINPALTTINTYLSKQPNGGALVSAKADQALRYVKRVAVDHNDFNYEHLDDYINTFSRNMDNAYGVSTGFNYVMDKNNVPLEENQMQVLASHSLNEVREKLLKYKTPGQVETMFSIAPPILVSSPGGRITVVDPNGNAIPDKDGHPAFDTLYNEGVWRNAEHDTAAKEGASIARTPLFGKPFQSEAPSAVNYLRGKAAVVRPVVEGNIDVENRPKVYDKHGNWETVKTITVEMDGKTVLLPTIINGKNVTNKEATEHFKKTHEHLGIFKTREEANKYDKQLHERMGWLGASNKWDEK